MACFVVGFVVYSFFLGGIDGLPLLPGDYQPGESPEWAHLPIQEGGTESKIKMAWGNECEELRREIRLDLRSKGVLLAAGHFDIKPDGRVELTPCSFALFPKSKEDGKFPEINTVQCEIALITLDRPVTNLTEMNSRKIVAVELRGNRGVTIINNRRTPERNDDIVVLISNGPMYYDERKNLIWTDGYVQLLDSQSQPHPTKITAKGMELKLAENSGPNAAKGKKVDPQGKGDGPSPVEQLILKSNVDMHF